MFSPRDPTPALDGKREILRDRERYYRNRRRFYFSGLAVALAITAVAIAQQAAGGGSDAWMLVLVFFPVLCVASATLWVNAWSELMKMRRVLKLLEREIASREFQPDGTSRWDLLGEEDKTSCHDSRAAMAVKKHCQMAARELAELASEDEETRRAAARRLHELRGRAAETALTIKDGYFYGFALQQLIDLRIASGEIAEARAMFRTVEDTFLRDRIIKAFPNLECAGEKSDQPRIADSVATT